MDKPLDKAEFEKTGAEKIAADLYEDVLKLYTQKNAHIAEMAMPVVRNVFESPDNNFENIVVPITDGKKGINVTTNLQEAVSSEGRQLIRDLEKAITLAMIDDSWKEHLRDMDDLRQSVGNAQYEQKDPLLIYKFEAFELFKTMVDKANREIASFLFKGQLPTQDHSQVREAKTPKRVKYDELRTSHPPLAASGGGEATQAVAPPKAKPVVSEKRFGRNDAVKVQNLSTGEIKSMKYKKAEPLIESEQWMIVD
jgi:preprotein translocase subunit SecA